MQDKDNGVVKKIRWGDPQLVEFGHPEGYGQCYEGSGAQAGKLNSPADCDSGYLAGTFGAVCGFGRHAGLKSACGYGDGVV